MRPGPKLDRRNAEARRALIAANGRGKCWVCGSVRGMKAGRNGYKLRCTRCEAMNRTNHSIDSMLHLNERTHS